jgi:tetratricopeptide (TPR) repeat protein
LYVRTPDSTIKGRKVVGVKFQFPAFPMPGDRDAGAQMGPLMDYSFRMTTVGDLALMAPDDQRLGELIDMAARMKAKPATGPLMQGTVDLGQYLKYLITLMPDTGMAMPELPATGRMKFRMDVKNGRFSSMMTVPMEGIKSLAAYSKQMEAAVQAGAVAQEEPQRRTRQRRRIAEPEETPLAPPEEAPPLDPELDPDYWFEKGGLLSTYGNDKAAIPAYKKAIKLDPARSDAYFNLGVSYGEIGEYELALASINKAIELNPTKGLYFYGRARVHLLANDTDKAMADFKRAAEAGNADAQQFLQREGIK